MQQNIPQMKRVLGTKGLIIFGLAYMVPLTIFTTYGQVTVLSQGTLPLAYVLTLLTMIFTALSYCKMTRAIPLSGSAYSYVQKTFGGQTGFIVGWSQILDYLFLPVINHLVIGLYLHEVFPHIPMFAIILTSICTVTMLNIIGVKLVTSVNFIIIFAQFVFIAVFVVLSFNNATLTTENLLKPLMLDENNMSGLFSGAAILCLAFLGFDAIATMTEEATEAKKTVPKAILYTVLIAGAMFLIISYSAHIAYPNWQNLMGGQDTASLVITSAIGGKWLMNFFLTAYITGVFTSALSAQASVSRILYAMGREGVLPQKFFYHLHPKYQTPYFAIIGVAIISLSSLFMSLNLVVSMISFGALGAFTFVNLSVIKHYIINQSCRDKYTVIHCGILPLIGVICCFWLWTSLDRFAMSIGLFWVAIGLVYLCFLTRGFRVPPPAITEEEYGKLLNI